MLSKHFHQQIGVSAEKGGSFFLSYGDQVGSMWKAFGAVLTGYADRHPSHQDEIVDAAVETFQCLLDWADVRLAQTTPRANT